MRSEQGFKCLKIEGVTNGANLKNTFSPCLFMENFGTFRHLEFVFDNRSILVDLRTMVRFVK